MADSNKENVIFLKRRLTDNKGYNVKEATAEIKGYDPAEEEQLTEAEHGTTCRPPRNNTRPPQGKYWKIAFYLLAGLAIILLITILCLTVLRMNRRIKMLEPKERQLCVPCTTLDPASKNKETYSECFKENTVASNSCCCEASKMLEMMIATTTKAYFEDEYPSRLFSDDNCSAVQDLKPSAKVSGISFSDMNKSNDSVVHWNIDLPCNFMRNVSYTDGMITIKVAGYYYVSFQLMLKVENKFENRSTDRVASLPATINRVNHKSNLTEKLTIILESSDVICADRLPEKAMLQKMTKYL